MDYISREKLLDKLNKDKREAFTKHQVWLMVSSYGIQSEDVEPIKHGHWDDCSNMWCCSVCGRDSRYDSDYCPNCGARMDLKGEE